MTHLAPTRAATTPPPAPATRPQYAANEDGTGIIIAGDDSGISHATMPTPELLADLNAGRVSLGTMVAATAMGGYDGPQIRIVPAADAAARQALAANGPSTLQAMQDMIAGRTTPASARAGADVINNSWGPSNSSLAVPRVAGAVALMLQANPGMTTAQVRDALQSTSVNGLIDVKAAVAAAQAAKP